MKKTLTFPYLLAFDRCRTKKKISRSFWDPRPFFLRLASVGGIFNLVQAVSSYFNLISFFWLPAKAQVPGEKTSWRMFVKLFNVFAAFSSYGLGITMLYFCPKNVTQYGKCNFEFESLVVTKVLLGDNPFLGKQEKFAQGRNPKNPLIHSVWKRY